MAQSPDESMVLLTGATGYLGSQIAGALIAQRVRFRVLVREPSRLAFDPAQAGCEVAVGDLVDPSAVRAALKGVKSLVHTAALVKMWVPDRREFWQVNFAGFRDLLQMAANSGVERIIYTSSFIALGPSSDVNAGEELHNPGPFRNEYEASKAWALEWLRSEGFARLPVVALFPGVIYGPGPMTQGNLVGGMIQQYLGGKFPGLLGSGNQRWSFSFNEDVVAAHLAALDHGQPGEQYLLGGDNRSLNDFFRVLGDLSGVRRPVRHLPFAAGKMAGALEVFRAKCFGHQPQLTPGVVEVFKYDWVYSSAKAVKELGYRVTPLEEGLKKTLAI